MQTDGYVEASRHIFYIFHFERTKLHNACDSEKEKKNHTMVVSTLIFFLLMCLHSVVHNKAQEQLYIPGIFICGLCSEMEFLP
jgi:hypothetical protein